MELSEKISRSYSKSPPRSVKQLNPSPRPKLKVQPHNLYSDFESQDYQPTPQRVNNIRLYGQSHYKSKSPQRSKNKKLVYRKSPHRKSAKIVSIDLRDIGHPKERTNQYEQYENPPMIFSSNPRKKPSYLKYSSNKSPRKDIQHDVRKAMMTYGFNRKHMKSNERLNQNKRRVNFDVNDLTQKSLRQFNLRQY